MAAPFNPPSAEGKPAVPKWNPPPPTSEALDWAKLHRIELSLLDSPDPKGVEELVQLRKTAILEDGFLYLTDYGVSLEQLQRQFDLAQYLRRNISEGDKQRLLWDPSSGVFAGLKRRLGWKREAGEFDGIEQFNFYRGEFEDPDNKVPKCIKPFFPEITAFCECWSCRMTTSGPIYSLKRVPVEEGYFCHALFYPLLGEDKKRCKGVRIYGHTDYGTTMFLFSVPVTALHIWLKENKWRPVKYDPGSLVNIGEALEIISGGHFKATKHKVTDTPADQGEYRPTESRPQRLADPTHFSEEYERLSLVQFNASVDMRLAPMVESPLLQREGFVLEQGVFQQYKKVMDAGLPVATNKQWREIQISTRSQVPPEKRSGGLKTLTASSKVRMSSTVSKYCSQYEGLGLGMDAIAEWPTRSRHRS